MVWKPTKDEFDEWKENPTTKWVIRVLEEMADEYAKSVGYGYTYDRVTPSAEKIALKTAETFGYIQGVKALCKMKYKE